MKVSNLWLGIVLIAAAALIVGQGCPPPDNGGGGDTGGGDTGGGDTGGGDTGGGDTGGGDTGGGDTVGNSGVTGQYVGSDVCITCHVNITEHWQGTLHARALETLEAIGQGTNAACLPCHTVGFGETGGFVDRATTNVLAGVGCEDCHGPARDHVQNVNDETLYPQINMSADVCGACHTGEHHPTFDEWQTSGHAHVTEHVDDNFIGGSSVNSCGKCHSGEFFVRSFIRGETYEDDAFAGQEKSDLIAITCAVCHDPHAQTGNAPTPEDGRDFQLRFPEVASPAPTNTVDAATNQARFNLCGQCHHSRGRTWDATTRGPHHSVQANVYVGEMPVPEDTPPLVQSRTSIHSFATEQCATCHLYREDFQSEEAPAISGHTFQVNELSCASSNCHPSMDQAVAAKSTLQTEIQARLDDIHDRLGDPATWEYTSDGGPDADGQALISDEIKKVRFMYHYVVSDGSLGMHNPDYVRSILEEADDILTGIGL